jgi:hypothetical protein
LSLIARVSVIFSDQTESDIYFAASYDRGSHWTDPQRVNETLPPIPPDATVSLGYSTQNMPAR